MSREAASRLEVVSPKMRSSLILTPPTLCISSTLARESGKLVRQLRLYFRRYLERELLELPAQVGDVEVWTCAEDRDDVVDVLRSSRDQFRYDEILNRDGRHFLLSEGQEIVPTSSEGVLCALATGK